MSDSLHSRASSAEPSGVPPGGQPRLRHGRRFGESALIACLRVRPVIPQNSSSTRPLALFVRMTAYRLRITPKYDPFSSFGISIAPFSVSFHLRQPKSQVPHPKKNFGVMN
jgi:hypothetical protein